MLKLVLLSFCFQIVLAMQGSPKDPQRQSECVLQDAPRQCGSFCLSALSPLFVHSRKIRTRLDGIEAGQLASSENLRAGLQGVQTKLDAEFLAVRTKLESCKSKGQEDFEERLAKMEEHLKAIKTAGNAKDELKCNNIMKETIVNLQNQIKTKDDLINTQKKQINEGLKNRDDQIADLKNWIETSKRNQSNELSECRLKLDEMEPFKVSCSSSPHGWTVIQRRIDGSENFHRNWDDYKKGFGNVKGEFFIGLENLHQMTKARPHELYIKLGKVDGSTSYAHYDDFKIGSEDELYELKSIGIYSGEAGDSLAYHKNKKFSTFDRDNDESDAGNCAKKKSGGWWYGHCGLSFPNGKYYKDVQITNEGTKNGIYWGSWHDYDWKISLTYVEMMIRPKSL